MILTFSIDWLWPSSTVVEELNSWAILVKELSSLEIRIRQIRSFRVVDDTVVESTSWQVAYHSSNDIRAPVSSIRLNVFELITHPYLLWQQQSRVWATAFDYNHLMLFVLDSFPTKKNHFCVNFLSIIVMDQCFV